MSGLALTLPWIAEAVGGDFRGANPPGGSRIDVWVREFNGDPLAVSIKGSTGATVATFSGPALPGFRKSTTFRSSIDG